MAHFGPVGGHGPKGINDGGFQNTLNNAIAPEAPVDPIIQAAQIQSQAIESAIPLFQPFLDAGQQGLGFLQQAGTAGGLEEILSMIFGGENFGALRDERRRGVEGSLAAGGFSRSGRAIEEGADISSNLGLQILQMLMGTNTTLAAGGGGAAANIGNLLVGSAEATASGILGVEERNTNRSTNRSNNQTTLLSGIIGGLFSDPRLKENIKQIGMISELKLYSWNWIPEAKGTIVENFPTTGVLSTDVKEIYPDLVGEFGSFDTIDYEGLVKRLQ